MNHWNYRVVRRECDNEEEEFSIRSAYYKDGNSGHSKPDLIGTGPTFPFGMSMKELESDLERMRDALHKPVLEESDFYKEGD